MADIGAVRRAVRVSDFVCRMPPDGFVIVLRHVPEARLSEIASKVTHTARKLGRFEVDDCGSCSSGEARSAQALLSFAERSASAPAPDAEEPAVRA
jgi:hypothetical protein